jgi:hypothetical protein
MLSYIGDDMGGALPKQPCKEVYAARLSGFLLQKFILRDSSL